MTRRYRDLINQRGEESARVSREMCAKQAGAMEQAVDGMASAIRAGKKILVAGNGGSAADSQHFAAELVNRFLMERRPLPAVALTTDTSVLTSISNDYSFEQLFSRQVEALGKEGDVFLALSTSGASANIIRALEKANTLSLLTVGLTGRDGGQMAPLCDICISIDDPSTPRIQEAHHLALHIICELMEVKLFGEQA